MPYIKQEDRVQVDRVLSELMHCRITPDGKLNYILFALCKRTVKPSYNNYKNYIAELRSCADEISRKLLGPYEEEKIKENGDVL